MKATIDFDDQLYRQLKIEAARRGRTIRELVAEGVRHVLEDQPATARAIEASGSGEWRPPWFGVLRPWAAPVADHSMTAVRDSIAGGRSAEASP